MPGIVLRGRGSIAPDNSRPTEGPAPSALETMFAAGRVAEDDLSITQDLRIIDAYKSVAETLTELGEKPEDWEVGFFRSLVNTGDRVDGLYDRDAMWDAVQRLKKQRPGVLRDLPEDREAFERSVLNRGGQSQVDAATASRGPGWASLVGGSAVSLKDPANIASMAIGLGASKTLIGAIAREAATNAGVELVQQPIVARNRARRGEELTLTEAATNVAGAALIGGAVGGVAFKWDAIKALPKEAQERVWGQIVPHLPEKLRGKMEWDAIPDDALPDVAERLIGGDNLSPDESAAIDALRRDIEVRALNPFADDPAGQVAHQETLSDAMRRILARPDAPRPAVQTPRLTPAALNTGTAVRTGTVDIGARATVKRRIGIVESGGNNAAANPNSTALGKYQFIKGTWTRLYKARYGAGGLSDAQIAAKRSDPRLQEILMDDLMDYNARVLARAGSSGNAGDLYLAHFAGAETAARLLRADRKAPASSIFPPDAIAANGSILRGKTVGEVIDWAHRKMGSQAAPEPSMRAETAPVDDTVARLEAEIADIDRQLAQPDAVPEPERVAAAIARAGEEDGLDLAPIDYSDELPLPLTPLESAEASTGISSVTLRMNSADDLRAALQPGAPEELVRAIVEPRQRLLAMASADDPEMQAVARAVLGESRADALAQIADDVRAAEPDALPDQLAAVSIADLAAIGRWQAQMQRGMDIMRMRAAADADPQASLSLAQAEARWEAQTGAELPAGLRGDQPKALVDYMLREEIGLPPPAMRGAAVADSAGVPARGDAYGVTDEPGPLAEQLYLPFDEPDGRGQGMIADSLDHDMRALADDAATAERLGLDTSFRLDTGDDPRTLAEVLDAIDEEQAAIAAVRECL